MCFGAELGELLALDKAAVARARRETSYIIRQVAIDPRYINILLMNELYPPLRLPTESDDAQSRVSDDGIIKPKQRQEPAEENPHVRRYNMYPQKAFGGHVEAKVLPDGRIKYTVFPYPYDGSDERTIIVDPANPEEMRAVKQLHLIPDIKNDPGMGVYVIDADLLTRKNP